MIDLDQVPQLDLVLTGSVGVNLKGARLGKGGGFSDLEFALLCEAGRIDRRTVIATTVHPIQILRENLLMTGARHPAEPDRHAARGDRGRRRARAAAGVLWDHLQPPQIHEIPVLERFGYGGLARVDLASTGVQRAPRARPSRRPRSRRPRSTSRSFQGWTSVAATMPSSRARSMFDRAVVDEHVDLQLDAAR